MSCPMDVSTSFGQAKASALLARIHIPFLSNCGPGAESWVYAFVPAQHIHGSACLFQKFSMPAFLLRNFGNVMRASLQTVPSELLTLVQLWRFCSGRCSAA